jgi:hypothetical protein
MRQKGIARALLLLVLGLTACSSASVKDSSPQGLRILDAVVLERQYEAPTTGGASLETSGSWYMVFEAREGEATARYRFSVTRQQYIRFPEGTRVQIVLSDHSLREIRSAPGS